MKGPTPHSSSQKSLAVVSVPLKVLAKMVKGSMFSRKVDICCLSLCGYSTEKMTNKTKQNTTPGHLHVTANIPQCCTPTAIPGVEMHTVGMASFTYRGALEEALSVNGIKHTLVADIRLWPFTLV